LEAPAPVTVPGESFLLRTAVDNLLSNALEFSPPDTRIQISVTAVGGAAAELRVLDEGPGIPDYAMPRLFERFYSLPRPDTGRKSSGLGLKLVREVATLHGGTIALANRNPSGTCAILRLPVSPGEVA
jgi:two-component system sensor histidine kinase CreC